MTQLRDSAKPNTGNNKAKNLQFGRASRIPLLLSSVNKSRQNAGRSIGYGLKACLIAQSLNQIGRAYGQNNAILDNCHVRVAFATNDERTAKRVADTLIETLQAAGAEVEIAANVD